MTSTIVHCFALPVLQSLSKKILIGFVDHLEINEPEDLHERDELGKGKKCREIHYLLITVCQKRSISELHSCFNKPAKRKILIA